MFSAAPFSFTTFSFQYVLPTIDGRHNGEIFNFELEVSQEPAFTFVIDTSLETTLNIDLSNESDI